MIDVLVDAIAKEPLGTVALAVILCLAINVWRRA